ANPRALAELVTLPADAVFPSWAAVFEWMWLTGELSAFPKDRPASVRVEVARRRDALLALAIELGLPHRALSDATDSTAITSWVGPLARALADGTAPAVGGKPPRGSAASRAG